MVTNHVVSKNHLQMI